MNEQEHYNEDFMREQLSGYREMPPAPVWEGIEKALDAKKKKRRIFFWLFFAGTGMAGMLLALNYFHSAENHMALNRHAEIALYPKLKNTIQAARLNSEKPNEQAQSQQTESVKSVSHQSEKQNTQAPKFIQKPGKRKQTTVNNIKTSVDVYASSSAVTAENKQTGEVNSAENQMINRQNETFVTIPNPFAPNLQQTNPIGNLTSASTSFEVQKDCQLIPFIGMEGGSGALGYHRKITENNLSNAGLNPDSSGYSSRRFGIHSYATVYAGFRYKKYLSFSAGMGYENLYSVNPYKANYSAIGLTNDLLTEPGSLPFGILNVVAPDDFEFSSAMPPSENGSVKFSSHYLHAPVMLGFHLPIKKFSFGIQAGPAFHILLAQNARFINENGEERDIILKTPNRFNISLGVEPQLAYRIRNLEIVAAGNFRYRFLNIWKSSEVRIMPYNLSGSIGLRYHFGCR